MSPTGATKTGLDLVTVGRIGVDLYPEQSGRTLADVESFARSLGGSPTNVAVAAARLGLRSAVVTKVGADGFGDYALAALQRFGVDPSWVGTDAWLRTPVVFCELHPPDDFPLLFYREPRAPDSMLRPADLPDEAAVEPTILWTTGGGLAAEPSRSTTLAALRRRRAERPEALTIHDLDHRPSFWSRGDDPRALARRALGAVTIAVGNAAEAEMVTGEREPRAAAAALLELGPSVAIVKRGPAGVLALSSDGERVELPAVALDVVNGLGAGDAFGGALAYGFARALGLGRTLRLANAAGAIVASRLACADAMPELAEIEALVQGVEAA